MSTETLWGSASFMPYRKDATETIRERTNCGSHFGSFQPPIPCAFPQPLAIEEGGEGVSIGMAQRWQPPERSVTVRASSCRGMNTRSHTCLIWRTSLVPDLDLDRARALVLGQVHGRHHHRWPQVLPLHPCLHWHHRPRPQTDPPPAAFSTLQVDRKHI